MNTPTPLPDGARLLHIGPAKTGTTTLQSGFHHNRAAIAEHGVLYAGAGRQARSAAAAIALGTHVPGYSPKSMAKWERLVSEVQHADASRVVISSETFAHADDAAADSITAAFDPERLHIVITMRPLADILPSAWQQYVQGSVQAGYDGWLKGVLTTDLEGKRVTPSFWRRTRVDQLAARWAERLGADRVTVISLADQKRDFVLRVFEQLTGLPDGILVPDPSESNFSLPHTVAEVVRRFNTLYKSQDEWSLDEHARLIEFGAIDLLKRTGNVSVEPHPIVTPGWAVDRAGEIAGEMNASLRALGVNVIGDLDALTRSSRPAGPDANTPKRISTSDAAALFYTMMIAAKREGNRTIDVPIVAGREFRPQDLSGRELVQLLGARMRRRLIPGRK